MATAAPAPIQNPSGSLTGLSSKVSILPNVYGGGITGPKPGAQTMKPTTPPVSPLSSQPVSSFGSTAVPDMSAYSGAMASDPSFPKFTPGNETADQYLKRVQAYTASNPKLTANGSVVSVNGSGNITSPSSFNIDVSGPISSDALGKPLSRGDVLGTRKSYFDYVQGLSEAMQYSPEYLASLEALNTAKLKGAEIKSNFYTGAAPGATVGYAQGATARAEALNSIDQMAAANALQVQELVRQGNIEGAKALVNATAPMSLSPGNSLVSPFGDVAYGGAGAYSDYQAQQTYFNLAQTFPDANIPAYDVNLSPQQNLQRAQQLAAGSPSFASRNLIQVTDPSGAIYFVQKNQLQTNPDGSYTFLGPGIAAGYSADRSSLQQATQYLDQVQRSVNTADANFKLILGLMERAGINKAGSPIVNELENKVRAGVIGQGEVAAYRSAITALRQEYAQVLARGGQVTNEVRDEAERLIPENLSMNQLKKVESQIRAEGQTIIDEAKAQVQTIQGRLNTGQTASPSGNLWGW